MSEEVNGVRVSDYLPEINDPTGSVIGPVPVPGVKIEVSTDGGKTWTDVDASWDGKGSLDEHRQQAFAKIKQPGFGDIGKVKTDGE
jgi:hypothetical protein